MRPLVIDAHSHILAAEAEGEDAVRLSRIQNEAMTEMVTRHPDRFAALATIPLQDVDLAIAEMEHAFDMADFGCGEQVRRVLPAGEARDKVLGGNAAGLLKL